MIVKTVQGNVFDTSLNHIAFAVNTEGYNDSGFAGAVSSRFWPTLSNIGPRKLGETLSFSSKETDGKTFHALVCHSLEGEGWKKTPEEVVRCLDQLDVPTNEHIAVVLMGSGMIGQMMGANVPAILNGMKKSKKKLEVYTL